MSVDVAQSLQGSVLIVVTVGRKPLVDGAVMSVEVKHDVIPVDSWLNIICRSAPAAKPAAEVSGGANDPAEKSRRIAPSLIKFLAPASGGVANLTRKR